MKGKIIDIGTFVDAYMNKSHRVTIEFKDPPDLKLGEAEVIQK